MHHYNNCADKSVPNTPFRELIKQTPVIAITSALALLAVCTLIFIAYIVKKYLKFQAKKLQSKDQRLYSNLKKVDRKIESSGGIFSGKSEHIEKEHLEKGGAIVDQVVGSDSTDRGSKSGPPPRRQTSLHLRRQERVTTDSDLESGQPKFTDRTVTKFLANKLYIGLKHPHHGKTFRDIVERVLAETRANGHHRSTDAQRSSQHQAESETSLTEIENSSSLVTNHVDVPQSAVDQQSDNRTSITIDVE